MLMASAIALMTASVMISGIVAFALSYGFVRYYIEMKASMAVVIVSSLTIAISLFCVFIIPLDAMIVGGSLNPDGTQKDAAMAHQLSSSMRSLYYTFYFLLAIFVAFILPCTYFYHEYGGRTTQARVLATAKHTMVSITIFIIFLMIGLGLRNDKGQDRTWVQDISATHDDADAILTFLIGFLSVIGVFGWVTYTAYGMACLPFDLYRNNIRADGFRKLTHESDLGLQLRASHDKAEEEGEAEEEKPRKLSPLTAFGSVGGIVCLALGGLVILSLLLSTMDKFNYSECRYSCGFAITRRSGLNPVDIALTDLSSFFPLDYILFSMVVIYILLCSIYGMASLGIRVSFFRAHMIGHKTTISSGMLMGSVFLMFTILTLNMQLGTIAPHYVHFGGDQYYYPLNYTNSFNSTNSLNSTNLTMAEATYATNLHVCNMTDSLNIHGHDQCLDSQIIIFVSKIHIQLPFFGVILFFSNIIFVVAYALFTLVAIFDCHHMTLSSSKNDDIWDDDF